MRRKYSLLPYFFLILFISLVLFLLSATGGLQSVRAILEEAISSISGIYSISGIFNSSENSSKYKILEQENYSLRKQLVDQKELQKENQALTDQFQTAAISSANLLPARIIGVSTFIPGVSSPESFVVDKGSKDGVQKGSAVVYKDNAIGKITAVSFYRSQVEVITNKHASFAVSIPTTNALGVVKGQGASEMILDNVLLSETISVSDMVVTKGDMDIKGIGYPEGLLVGKIISIDKKPSALFQTAKVKSLIDFSKLSSVFIIIEN